MRLYLNLTKFRSLLQLRVIFKDKKLNFIMENIQQPFLRNWHFENFNCDKFLTDSNKPFLPDKWTWVQ